MPVLSTDRTVQLQLEESALIKAETHVTEGQSRIDQQEMRLAQLRLAGHDTRQAERLVEVMRQTLVEWERHLCLIRQRIEILRAEIDRAPSSR